MKVLVMTLKKRIERFSDFSIIPKDWQLVFAEFETDTQRLLELGGDADVIFVDAMQPVKKELIDAMPNLKMIHSEGVGFDWIDVEAATNKGVFVCNNAAANSKAVAEQAILLMLAVLRRTVEGDRMVRDARQIEAKSNWSLEGIRELWNCHVGIIGMGAIGQETAKRLKGFESKVSYYSRSPLPKELETELSVDYLPLEEILKECDIISLHLPSNDKTKNFMNLNRFRMMKKSSILINTARGEVVNQHDLMVALKEGLISGAGLDTISPEPVRPDNLLLQLPTEIKDKITFSPHIGGVTEQAFVQMHRFVWENIRRVEQGERPKNIVNG
ncbi:GyaR protein [Terrilactibacillus sp. BCM23-1]|uniref:GyaR protein n=1 Tax=Terrilactibacillus tamarindi TaxID=2599694 RepID=A0A6N8CU61_9BACI|nr:2-hydroxyacid dehydrogenase [Terrilactibacillus tamarindi]MTT32653.1 GyaR protein [Terrilactibacillus tamarindi]